MRSAWGGLPGRWLGRPPGRWLGRAVPGPGAAGRL